MERQESSKKYVILSAECWNEMALRMVQDQPRTFQFFKTKWAKFSDSNMDDIEVGGFSPQNHIRDANIVFLASFHNNDAILSQLNVLVVLLESFIAELTIVLPFFPMGTMERITKEGQVATANTIARLLSNLPFCGRPTRVMIYDIHALTSRFYIHNNSLASLHSTIPLLRAELGEPGEQVDAIAFPDEGSHKRFNDMFGGFPQVVCGKVREGTTRKVTIQDGAEFAQGKRVIIIDDLVRSGGTLYECGRALRESGAVAVMAFCAHADFKRESWLRFTPGGDRGAMFEKFYLTNSAPLVTNELRGIEPFVVLDIMPQVLLDL